MIADSIMTPTISRSASRLVAAARPSPPQVLALIRAASIMAAELALNSADPAASLDALLGEFGRNARHLLNKELRQ